MHLLEQSNAMAELSEYYRQWRAGEITTEEYKAAYLQIDQAYSKETLCDNGDKRIAQQLLGGRALCGVCIMRDRLRGQPPRLADERPGYGLSLPRVLP